MHLLCRLSRSSLLARYTGNAATLAGVANFHNRLCGLLHLWLCRLLYHAEQLSLPERLCTTIKVFDFELHATVHQGGFQHGEFQAILAAHPATKKVRCTLLAPSALPPVLTDAAATTLFAQTALPPVLADVSATTLLALTALPPMLTDAGPSTLPALTALPPVLTDAGPSALLALIAFSPMLTDA